MEKEWVFSVPLKVAGVPLQLVCWIIVLINAIFGVTFASFIVWGISISLVPYAAVFLAGNGILGAIFRRKIFPIPEPDIHCDTCNSKNVQVIKHEVKFFCDDCKKEYSLNAKKGKTKQT